MVLKLGFALLALSALPAAQSSGQSAPAFLVLSGEGAATKTLTTAELAVLPQSEVAITGRDSLRVVFRGPAVRSLMTLVGAPAGRELRGPNMLLVVVAGGEHRARWLRNLSRLRLVRIGL